MKNYIIIVALSNIPIIDKSEHELQKEMKASKLFSKHLLDLYLNKCIQLSTDSFFIKTADSKEQLKYHIEDLYADLFMENIDFLLPNNISQFFITELKDFTFSTYKEKTLALNHLINKKDLLL